MSSVDIIVPCHNYGRFLRQCVESVLAQSHRDLRVLILDDASRDNTAEVAAALAAADPRVAVHRHAVNRGHIATYNEGIGLVTADYMLLLDADDYLLPGAVARVVAVLDATPEVGLVHGACIASRPGDRLPPSDGGVEIMDSAAFLEASALRNLVCTPTAFVRTALQKKLGGYKPELPHAGDLEMWLRFALSSRVAFIRMPQAEHRMHDANMSRGYDPAADLRQCIGAFRPHLAEIRARMPEGLALAVRIRRILAERARRQARRAFVRGRLLVFARLVGLWLGESVAATAAALRR
ncbi:MAG: glycosyltransferase [Bauldia sp.]